MEQMPKGTGQLFQCIRTGGGGVRRVNANSTVVDEGGGREQGGARGRCLLGGHLPPAGPGGEREGHALRSRLAPALASEAWGRAGSHAGRWRGAARGAGLARGPAGPRRSLRTGLCVGSVWGRTPARRLSAPELGSPARWCLFIPVAISDAHGSNQGDTSQDPASRTARQPALLEAP